MATVKDLGIQRHSNPYTTCPYYQLACVPLYFDRNSSTWKCPHRILFKLDSRRRKADKCLIGPNQVLITYQCRKGKGVDFWFKGCEACGCGVPGLLSPGQARVGSCGECGYFDPFKDVGRGRTNELVLVGSPFPIVCWLRLFHSGWYTPAIGIQILSGGNGISLPGRQIYVIKHKSLYPTPNSTAIF